MERHRSGSIGLKHQDLDNATRDRARKALYTGSIPVAASITSVDSVRDYGPALPE
jgi:hypothetical protein